jgi:Family of unknown function (DUF6171)
VECQFERSAPEQIKCRLCLALRPHKGDPSTYHRICPGKPLAPSLQALAPLPETCCSKKPHPIKTFAGAMVGWAKSGFEISPKADERLSICESCDRLENGRCKECSCFVKLKVRLATEKCPLSKW